MHEAAFSCLRATLVDQMVMTFRHVSCPQIPRTRGRGAHLFARGDTSTGVTPMGTQCKAYLADTLLRVICAETMGSSLRAINV